MLPDTHTHLDAEAFNLDREAVLRRASDAGVDRVLTVGTDAVTSGMAVSLAQEYSIVFAAVGIHPHDVDCFEQDAGSVQSLLDEKRVVAVGEIGLDYRRGRENRTAQVSAFAAQVGWAADRGIAVCIHNRDADDDTLAVLQGVPVPVILHCFASDATFADRALAAGFYLSFAGNLTFPRAEELRDVASHVPTDRLLVETDAPVLAPQTWRGRRCEPAYVMSTATILASLHAISLERLAEYVSTTADTVFRWSAA